MILKQYYLGCLAHASYLLGDEASSTAVIVDPQRDIQQYLADAEKFGLLDLHVSTHFHADFVAGHLELRERCGAIIHCGFRAQADKRLRGDEGRRYARLPGTAPASPQNPRPHHRILQTAIAVLKDYQFEYPRSNRTIQHAR